MIRIADPLYSLYIFLPTKISQYLPRPFRPVGGRRTLFASAANSIATSPSHRRRS